MYTKTHPIGYKKVKFMTKNGHKPNSIRNNSTVQTIIIDNMTKTLYHNYNKTLKGRTLGQMIFGIR